MINGTILKTGCIVVALVLLLFVVAGCSDKPKRVSYSGDIETCNLMCQPQQPLGEMPISEAQTTDGWKFWR